MTRLVVWTIYGPNTSDFPGAYVARAWLMERENDPWPAPIGCVCPTLDEARQCVPAGFIRLPRDARDDPVIVETWI